MIEKEDWRYIYFRKALLYVSSTGMLVSLATLASHYNSQSASQLTPLIALIVYVISFSSG